MALYERWGGDPYDEEVAQLDHALQTAALAAEAGAADGLVAAALLHDVGHLLDLARRAARAARTVPAPRTSPNCSRRRSPSRSPSTWRPSATSARSSPSYDAGLSAGSRRSLPARADRSPLAEVAAFEARPGWRDAVALRRWDDAGKVDEPPSPGSPPTSELLWSLARSES